MRRTSSEVERAREAAAHYLTTLPLSGEQRLEISKRVAKFTAALIRDDRVRRQPNSSLVKLVDVFFNGRPA